MKFINRNLPFVAAACLTLIVGMTAVTVFGQKAEKAERVEKVKEHSKGFCSNNNWSSDDKVSFTDLREMTIPASGSIRVDGGQNGGISIKGEERGDVLVRACVQAWGSTDEAARAVASGIRIGTSGTIKAENSSEPNNWSVSYQILVPRATNLNLNAHNGGISIAGVDGAAEFETMNGGVSLTSVSGSVKGRTTNGGVKVYLSGTSWRGSGLDIQTTNGGVHISMPENYAAHVETGTVNGGFNSDIVGLSVERTDENGRRKAAKISTDINGGGAPIRVTTTNGGVKITSIRD